MARLCSKWPDVALKYAVLLDAAGWSSDRIADYLSMPVERVEAILDPRSPERSDDLPEGFDRKIYSATVEHVIETRLLLAYQSAARECTTEGFGNLERDLADRARQHEFLRDAAIEGGAVDLISAAMSDNMPFLLSLLHCATKTLVWPLANVPSSRWPKCSGRH